MKKRILSTLLAFCLLLPLLPSRAAAADTDMECPAPSVAYERIMALQKDWPEGTPWANEKQWRFSGGTDGGRIAENGIACAAFAYMLSDTAFGTLPGKLYYKDEEGFQGIQNVKVGDILRIKNSMEGEHSVVVTAVTGDSVQIAEGNYNGRVHWGRTLGPDTLKDAFYRITRYPNDISPDDPHANDPLDENAKGDFDGSLHWNLNKMGTLTISGNGTMESAPWRTNYSDKINRVVIETGVTSICSDAFKASKVASVTIPETVKIVGASAFQGSTLQSITLPASITEVKDSAFFDCPNLTTATFKGTSDNAVIMGDNIFARCWVLEKVTLPKKIDKISKGMFQASPKLTSVNIPEGVENIGESAFASCEALTSLYIPVSVTRIELGVFANTGLSKISGAAIYFAGTESQWNSVSKIADTQTALAGINVKYNESAPTPGPDTPTPGPGPDTPDNPDNPNTPDTPPCSNGHTWDGGTVTSSASCTSGGTRTYRCTVCGETKTESTSSLGHSWGSGVITTEPDEDNEGVRTYTCSRCRRTKTEPVPATGHVQHRWDEGKVTTEPTCTKEGVLTYTCQKCGTEETEPIPATGTHSWDEGKMTTEPGCVTDGERTYTCSVCQETRKEPVPAAGRHEWGEGVFAGDCAEGGTLTYTCSVCGETKTEPAPIGTHTWDNGKLETGTCTEGGTQTYTCSVCGKTKTEPLPADGHTWDEGEVTKKPACTSEGVKTFICVKCGETRTEAIAATGHAWDDGVVTKPETCTKNGTLTITCTRCGEKKTEIIPAVGHNYTGSDEAGYICQNCGDEIPAVLKKPYDAIQNKVETEKVTVVVTGEDGKPEEKEIEQEVKVQVLPNTIVVDKKDDIAVKTAVEKHLSSVLDRIIGAVADAASQVVSKIEDIRTEPGVHNGKNGTWYICKVSLVRKAVRSADEMEVDEIWVFVSDEDPVVAAPDPEGETYYISIPKTGGGEIIPGTRYAAYGERVTLSVHPDKGYELDSLTVKDIRGRALSLRETGGNQRVFTMPSCRVTVEAAFVEIRTETDKTDKTDKNDSTASIPGTLHTDANPDDEPFTGLGTPGISGIVLNPAAMPFTDVPAGSWYYNGAEYVWKHYLMSGVSDSQFAPGATTSRAMIWTVLARMNNIRTDVNPGSTWYERGMLWAVEKGLTDGTNPMGEITREQLAAMLWRNAGHPDGSGADLSVFSDEADISGYARGAVQWAAAVGILNGSDGKLNPKGTATRAEVAVMIMRYGEKAA